MDLIAVPVALGATIAQLLTISGLLTLVCKGLFDTRVFNKWVGKGIDGEPSRFLPAWDLRPVLAVVLGVWVAHEWNFLFIASVAGKTQAQLLDMSRSALELDNVLTGIGLGLGPKFWLALGKRVFEGQRQIASQVRGGKE